MARERDLIRLEKEIKSKMIQVKNKKVTPKDSGIARLINLMKTFDEALFERLISDYKKVLSEIK